MAFYRWAKAYLTRKLNYPINSVSKISFWTRERKTTELSRSKEIGGRKWKTKKERKKTEDKEAYLVHWCRC